MAKLLDYKSYLERMVAEHYNTWDTATDPYYAANCKQQYMAFKQALEEFEHTLSVMGV